MDESVWLRDYVEHGSQQAFTCLVERHADLVYSAALRQLHDRHLAEDVTQTVFVTLAKKASRLKRETALSAWLLVTTRFIALDYLRARARRARHERTAAQMVPTTQTPSEGAGWQEMQPHLDAALASLTASDRRAIALRYFEDLSPEEVARRLGLSHEAARQRVHRATVRMRQFFAARGVEVLAMALGPAIAAHAVKAAPAGLAASSVAAASLAAKSGVASSGVLGTGKGAATIMATTYTKFAAGAAAMALLAGGGYIGYKMMTPPPRITVIATPEAQITSVSGPDWNKRFVDAYQLAPGQIVKFVDHVPIAERLQYWNSQPNSKGYFALTPQSTLVLKSNGPDLHWTSFAPGWIPLAWAISFGTGLQGWHVDNSIPQGMKFTGDWVFKENATTQQVMDALANLVSERLGRQVRFVKRSVIRDVLVARGTYRFVPLSAYPLADAIQMSDRPKKPDAQYKYSVSLAEVFGRVSMAKAMQVIDETGSGNRKIKIYEDTWHDPDAFVQNIAAQTSLRFDREPRKMEVWFMTDSDGTSPNTQPGVTSIQNYSN